MIKLEIDGKFYKGVTQWGEITLGKYIEVSKVEIPQKLLELWELSFKKSIEQDYKEKRGECTFDDYVSIFPEYYGRLIEILTNIPKQIIEQLTYDQRTEIFEGHFKHFVLSLIYSMPLKINKGQLLSYNPPKVEYFKLGREKYYFPQTLKLVSDEIPMANESIVSFVEASDLTIMLNKMSEYGIEELPLFISLYCRPKGEQYNQNIVIERKDMFKAATMDIVWSLFFCIFKLTDEYLSNIEIFSKGVLKAKKANLDIGD